MPDAPKIGWPNQTEKRSVQHYIDERPMWADGTILPWVPMTAMQWRIWWLAACGKFFVGFVIFVTGVALPLISREFGIDPAENGVVSSATLLGILIGAAGLGGLSDRFGRKTMFIVEMIIFVAFLALLVLCTNFVLLIICLFGLGVALGCDYPTAHMIISENISSMSRGRLVLGAYTFQAVGALSGTAVGYLVLSADPTLDAWRWMYAAAIGPAVAVTIGRFYITESPNWLHVRGATERAELATRRLLLRNPLYPRNITLMRDTPVAAADRHDKIGFGALFGARTRRATILASVPWFLQDLGSYGIAIFTPTILAVAFGDEVDHIRSVSDLILSDIFAAKGAALISTLLIIGIVVATLLTDRVGRIRLQIVGFIGCAVGLFIAALANSFDGSSQIAAIFTGFMLFNFMTNLGPSSHTYLIAGEVFSTAIRGTGAGFAAAVGKTGAVVSAFLFPILLADIGTGPLLCILVAASILGAVTTWAFQIETAGVSLEEIGQSAPA
jgi:MFS transporter, putative metabolite transport protein